MNIKLTAASAMAEQTTAVPPATTLPAQRAVNLVIRGVLRTPLLCRVAGSRLITIHVVGRKSGKRYALPVAYTRDGDQLLVGAPFGWGRNLATGQPVNIRLKGKLRSADVEVITDEAGVVEHYALMARDNHQFAKFNNIGFDDTGNPRVGDLRAAWAHGARVFRFTVS